MENEREFYPELSEEGAKEAQILMDKFKVDARKALDSILDEYLGKVYCDIIPDIESDSWWNFRNTLMDGFKNYDNQKIRSRYDFAEIRKRIFEQFHDDIIKDLNQDLVEENKSLKETIEQLQEMRRHGW